MQKWPPAFLEEEFAVRQCPGGDDDDGNDNDDDDDDEKYIDIEDLKAMTSSYLLRKPFFIIWKHEA